MKINKTDCILCIMPFMRYQQSPFLAPYLLKTVLKNNGYSSKIIDLNKNIGDFLNLSDFDNDFFSNNDIKNKNSTLYKTLDEYLDNFVDELLSYSPKLIALSLMCYNSYIITEIICKKITLKKDNTILAIGGPGSSMCGDSLLKENYIDAYVSGDGETPILNILKGNFNSIGINGNGINFEDLKNLPFADYSDIEDKSTLNIQGSRGCSGKCSFCNSSGNYRSRPGKTVAEEMIYNHTLYNTKNFSLIDNAINISSKFINDLCTTLTNHYNDNVPFKWFGHAKAQCNLNFDILKKSGCQMLMVGIESGSQKILNDMNKNLFLSEANKFIEKCVKSKIKLKLYFTLGYPTETDDDFNHTVNLMESIKDKYPEIELRVVSYIVIWKNSKLYEYKDLYDIDFGDDMFMLYTNWESPYINKEVRHKRFNKLKEICRKT